MQFFNVTLDYKIGVWNNVIISNLFCPIYIILRTFQPSENDLSLENRI